VKLAEHNILSLRCAMTALGYRWKTDMDDRSLDWQAVNHWKIWDTEPGYDFQQLDLHPVCSCDGDICTTYVSCTVRVRSDLSLDGWLLMESYAGCSTKEIDPWAYGLEDLPEVLNEWVRDFSLDGPNPWLKSER
jgi:hypothetical protein